MAHDQLIRNNKVFDFWLWINNLTGRDYLRAQQHCTHFFGGYVSGIHLENGILTLNIEL